MVVIVVAGVARAINGGRGLSRCGIKRFTTGPQISTDAMDECEGGSRRATLPIPPVDSIWVRLPDYATPPPHRPPSHPSLHIARHFERTLGRDPIAYSLNFVVERFRFESHDPLTAVPARPLKILENLELDDFARGIGTR